VEFVHGKNLTLRKKRPFTKDKLILLCMTLVPFCSLLVFAYGPIWGWVYAFFNYRIGMPLKDCTFVGLHYFKIAFMEPDLYRVLRNTLAMSGLSLTIIPIAATFAILLSEIRYAKYKKFLQTASTLPNFMSWVIIFSIFFVFLAPGNGIINIVLSNMGLSGIQPLGDVDITWYFQTAIRFWKELGYTSIIFFAAIASIDPEQYDAARVDGAGRLGTIWHITVPGIMPTVIVMLLISIGFLLSNGFEQYYVFYNGLVSPNLEVLDYYVYRVGLANKDIPFATALSVSKTFVSVFLVFFSNYVSKKIQGKSVI
jgi:ABC-type polysaccharide transport system permease subunit